MTPNLPRRSACADTRSAAGSAGTGIRRHARFKIAGRLSLTLLVLWLFLADDHHHAVATNHLATVAAWLHRRSHLHLESPHLLMTPCLMSVGVTLTARIATVSAQCIIIYKRMARGDGYIGATIGENGTATESHAPPVGGFARSRAVVAHAQTSGRQPERVNERRGASCDYAR